MRERGSLRAAIRAIRSAPFRAMSSLILAHPRSFAAPSAVGCPRTNTGPSTAAGTRTVCMTQSSSCTRPHPPTSLRVPLLTTIRMCRPARNLRLPLAPRCACSKRQSVDDALWVAIPRPLLLLPLPSARLAIHSEMRAVSHANALLPRNTAGDAQTEQTRRMALMALSDDGEVLPLLS